MIYFFTFYVSAVEDSNKQRTKSSEAGSKIFNKSFVWYILILAMATCEFPLMFKVRLLTGANLHGVWSKFMIIECGTAYFPTKFATWYRNSNFAARLASFSYFWFWGSGSTFTNSNPSKKLVAHVIDFRSVNLRCLLLLLAINPFAVTLATKLFTTPPFFLSCSKRRFTYWSSAAPNITGLPCFKRDILLVIAFSCLVISLYWSLSFRAVLSPKFRWG